MNAVKTLSQFSIAASLALLAVTARADAVTDWNVKANDLLVAGRVAPPPANRVLAIAQVAVFDAVNAITGRNAASGRVALEAAPGASVDAAVAAAMRGTLVKLLAPQQAEIGSGPEPRLATTSPTAPGVTRAWGSIAEFAQEVANAPIYDGVHYRNSTEVGTAMGRKVGEMVAAKVVR